METNGFDLTPENQEQLMRMLGAMKGLYVELSAKQAEGKPVGEIKTAIDKVSADIEGLQAKQAEAIAAAKARLDAIEEIQRRPPSVPEPPKSLGQIVTEDKNLIAAFQRGGQFSVTIPVKGPMHLIGKKDITGVSTTWPQMITQVAQPAHSPFGVRMLVPSGRTTSGAIEYLQETAFTNNANVVAEGAAKPKSDKTLTTATSVVRTIAHYFKVSKQTYEDLPMLASLIEQNGVYGVQYKEDQQLLNGSGVAPQLQGFMGVATAGPIPGTAAAGFTLIDAIGAAVFDLAAKGYIADGLVVNPADWGVVAMLKNTQGNYLFANPLDYAAGGRIWGARMVASANMASGSFLVGQFAGNAQIFDREEVNVQVATQNEDDFIKNMLTVLIEERLALVIYVPAAFEKGVKPVLAGTEGESEPARSRK